MEKPTKPRRRSAGQSKAFEQFATLPGQASNNIDVIVAADDHRQRMAEYCRRAAARYELRETAEPMVHQGEFYLPGVF